MSDRDHPLAPPRPWRSEDDTIFDASHRVVCHCNDQYAARAIVEAVNGIDEAERLAESASEAHRTAREEAGDELDELKSEVAGLKDEVVKLTREKWSLEEKLGDAA